MADISGQAWNPASSLVSVTMRGVGIVVGSFLLVVGLFRLKALGRPATDDDSKGRLLPFVFVAVGMLILLYGVLVLGLLR
jgi:membrane protein CcdC involved in cytochrome C biogenesis